MRQRRTKRRAPQHAAKDKRLSTARATSSSRIDSFLYSNRDRPAVTRQPWPTLLPQEVPSVGREYVHW